MVRRISLAISSSNGVAERHGCQDQVNAVLNVRKTAGKGAGGDRAERPITGVGGAAQDQASIAATIVKGELSTTGREGFHAERIQEECKKQHNGQGQLIRTISTDPEIGLTYKYRTGGRETVGVYSDRCRERKRTSSWKAGGKKNKRIRCNSGGAQQKRRRQRDSSEKRWRTIKKVRLFERRYSTSTTEKKEAKAARSSAGR